MRLTLCAAFLTSLLLHFFYFTAVTAQALETLKTVKLEFERLRNLCILGSQY